MSLVPRGLVTFFRNVRDYREIQRFFDDLAAFQGTSSETIDNIQADIASLNADVATLQGQVATLQTDVATLQGEVSALETKKFNATATGGTAAWDDHSFNLINLANVGSGVPSLTNINSTNRWAHAYTNEAVENNEKRQAFGIQTSHGIKANSEVRMHIHIYTGARVPGVDEYVRFEVVVGVTNRMGVLSTSTYTADCLIPANTPAYTHVTCPIATISGSNIGASADIGGVIRRKSSHANDTYEDTIYPIFGDPHVQFDRRGTASEFS